jgi:uncharacterized protein YuzE
MKIDYDKENDDLFISFKPGAGGYDESEEIKPGIVVDYDSEDRIIAIEFEYASKILALDPEALEQLAARI